MNDRISKMMTEFEYNEPDESGQLSETLKGCVGDYAFYLQNYNGGCGMIGENSYLILWSQAEIEEFNVGYAVEEFLADVVLIGSDGGDTAYGINAEGAYIEVPFIGMDDEKIVVIANQFEGFIQYLYER